MNVLMHWLSADDWRCVVQALLHTLWQGALAGLVLWFALKRVVNPVTRHRLCLLALAGVLLAGLCTWAVLDSQATSYGQMASTVVTPPALQKRAVVSDAANMILTPGEAGGTGNEAPVSRGNRWFAWLALIWMTGAAFMLSRAARSVAGAEELRRSARPLENEAVLALIRVARAKLGLARRVRVVVTDRLTSPAVAGILVPTLILPLSLVTVMPLNQLQLIVLHELAHIRRGDYLANLFQLLVESLLFFNPTVWWISRQTRQEREACCDAMAIALASGERLEYARTLAEVAGRSLGENLAAAPGFADKTDRPGLKDRVQRVLVPGYRPELRLTWRALVGSLFFGGALLLLSALGTHWTVLAAEKLLTPQERIDRIETTMKNLGQAPEPSANANDAPEVEVTAVVRTADGSPLPRNRYVQFLSISRRNTSGYSAYPDKDGICKSKTHEGDLYIGALIDGYAPAVLGPVDTRGKNRLDDLELTLDRGFPVSIQVLDADTGENIPNASLSCTFWFPRAGSNLGNPRTATADENGTAQLPNCASLPLHVSVNKDGYEIKETVFEHLSANDQLKVYARRALPVAGRVTDAKTGRPISNASVFILYALDAPGVFGVMDPWHPVTSPNAKSDQDGRFAIDRLPRSGRFWLLVKSDGHAGAVLADVRAAQTNLNAALGPEMIVRGRIEGDLSALGARDGQRIITSSIQLHMDENTQSFGNNVPVRVEDGVGYFEYTNVIAGPATVGFAGYEVTTNVSESVDNWVIKLSGADEAQKREVVVRFTNASGVAPKGTVKADLPGPMPNTAVDKELEIQNGEVHFEALTGRAFSIEPAQTVGFWFERQFNLKILAGTGAQVISIPTITAGAIYAEARDTDGSVSRDIMFSVREEKRSPLVPGNSFTVPNGDSYTSGEGPRHFVASPLPLDGTYEIIAYRSNNFCVSGPVTLSDAEPDRKVELRFQTGNAIEGRVFGPDGRPATNLEVGMACEFSNSSFGLKGIQTDETGRFRFDDCAPATGQFLIDLQGAGLRAVRVPVDMATLPITVHLQPGLKLSGQVVDDKTGKPVPQAQVRAWAEGDKMAKFPSVTSVTDEQGRFELSTLSDTDYRLIANHQSPWLYAKEMPLARAANNKPVVIKLFSAADGN
jgi:beta-lactamase regulating signal transducer with metallopeptidase domain/protocatechuate 3,4-dioxygenase beta subunit